MKNVQFSHAPDLETDKSCNYSLLYLVSFLYGAELEKNTNEGI